MSKSRSRSKSTTRTKKPEGRNQRIGRIGEEIACHHLEDNDITILERNWKCKGGEADIIAEEEGVLVFVEVKTRMARSLILPETAVTRQKRQRYEQIALSYLFSHERPSGQVRFDVIAITLKDEEHAALCHHRDAFAAGPR